MKSFSVWILLLALFMSMCAAQAEPAGKAYTGEVTVPDRFTVKWITPDGYTLEGVDAGNADWIGDPGFMIATLVPKDADAGQPTVNIAIARDARYTGVGRMNDLDEEKLAAIEQELQDEGTLSLARANTADGSLLLVLREALETGDFVQLYTVRQGYEIKLVLSRVDAADAAPITEDEVAMALRFRSDLSFEAVA